MEQHSSAHRTTLFTIRVWPVDYTAGQPEWRGRIRHVVSGEQHHFRTWAEMISLLQAMLPAEEGKS